MAKKAAAKKSSTPQPPAKAKPSTKSSAGTADNPWTLLTPPGSSEFIAYRDPDATRPYWSFKSEIQS